ncbi:hypothetical protein E2C01_002412 [Portunus trituberculatus]|uniref:Uncharacterized protein n=1 Tax=Portunus trituberculatus TaxID=210409 RepID=A0A5B7CM72_PORTR|nr:hypothetical protein [Portunus trituberculatus]
MQLLDFCTTLPLRKGEKAIFLVVKGQESLAIFSPLSRESLASSYSSTSDIVALFGIHLTLSPAVHSLHPSAQINPTIPTLPVSLVRRSRPSSQPFTVPGQRSVSFLVHSQA